MVLHMAKVIRMPAQRLHLLIMDSMGIVDMAGMVAMEATVGMLAMEVIPATVVVGSIRVLVHTAHIVQLLAATMAVMLAIVVTRVLMAFMVNFYCFIRFNVIKIKQMVLRTTTNKNRRARRRL